MKTLKNIFGTLFSKSTNGNSNNNVTYTFSFERIATVQQFCICKDIIAESRKNGNENGTIYTIDTVNTAKQMLSTLRKENKQLSDRFTAIRNASTAHTDTAKLVCKQVIVVTDDIQNNIKERALGALNYAIKKYNSNNIVPVSDIKTAFHTLTETDIYRYFSVSTMQFNAKALLAKCVDIAIKAKAKQAKETLKECTK